MGLDIIMYAEKNLNERWQFCMPESNFTDDYCNNFDIGGRRPALFQILSKIYGGKYGENFKSISFERGLPRDISEEAKWYLEDLIHCSYLTLKEILEFDWELESKEYGQYKELAGDEFFNIIQYLQSLVSETITESNIRIVFGYSY